MADVAIVLDLPQLLNVLGGQLVLDGALDNHLLVGPAGEAFLIVVKHSLFLSKISEHFHHCVGLDGGNLLCDIFTS